MLTSKRKAKVRNNFKSRGQVGGQLVSSSSEGLAPEKGVWGPLSLRQAHQTTLCSQSLRFCLPARETPQEACLASLPSLTSVLFTTLHIPMS